VMPEGQVTGLHRAGPRLALFAQPVIVSPGDAPPHVTHRIGTVCMSAISREDVAHLASLARIDLSPSELDRLAGQLGVILGAVATVQQVAGADIPATSHPMALTNVTRPDTARPGLAAQDALAGAPEAEQQRFRVPRILEED
jgi:aspartyl-tRNA(Asn)/glutamyl-tRNA(Gln) amidotransferase subunit C